MPTHRSETSRPTAGAARAPKARTPNPATWERRELLAIREIAGMIGTAAEPAKTIDAMLHLLSAVLDLRRPRVLLRNGVTNEIAINHAYGMTPEEIRRGVFKAGDGITGRAFKSGHALMVEDIDAEPLYLGRTLARADLPPQLAFLAVPIRIAGLTAGVLAAHRQRQPDRALSEDLPVMQLVANLVGQMLTPDIVHSARIASLEAENAALRATLAHPPAALRLDDPSPAYDTSAVSPQLLAAWQETLALLPSVMPLTAPQRRSPVPIRDYQNVDDQERGPIEDALRLARNNKSRAAQRLGMTLRQLNYRIQVLQIALPARLPQQGG
jgi:Nif-specific regulatory protein